MIDPCHCSRPAVRSAHFSRAEDELFGDAATEQGADTAIEKISGMVIAVRLRQIDAKAQSAAARDDADFVDRVVLRHVEADDGVTRLVIRRQPSLLL